MNLTNERDRYIGERLRRARHAWTYATVLGKRVASRSDLAAYVKKLVPHTLVTADVIENVEKGRTRLKLIDAVDIAYALGVPVMNLFIDTSRPFEINPIVPIQETNYGAFKDQTTGSHTVLVDESGMNNAKILADAVNELQRTLNEYPVHGLVDEDSIRTHKYKAALQLWKKQTTDRSAIGQRKQRKKPEPPKPQLEDFTVSGEERKKYTALLFKRLNELVHKIVKTIYKMESCGIYIPDEKVDLIMKLVDQAEHAQAPFRNTYSADGGREFWGMSYQELMQRVRSSYGKSLD